MTRDTAKVIIESNLRRLDETDMRLICFFILDYVNGKKKQRKRTYMTRNKAEENYINYGQGNKNQQFKRLKEINQMEY